MPGNLGPGQFKRNNNSQNQNPCRPKRPQGLDYTTYAYRHNALDFFCKPLQASGRKMGEPCNSFVFCYLPALGHDALILASRSMQGQENRRTMQHFRFLLYLTVLGAFAAIHPYIRALFNSCRPLPAFLKFLCLVAKIDSFMMP